MACKYTYGNQVYDSLDDLKVAVKNDLQRSADKEEVVDNNNQSNTAEGIYNKINKDKKTQSENVEIPGVGDMSDVTYSATTFWDKVVPEAVGQFGDQIIVAYRGAKKNSFLKNYQEGYPGATIGNPFDWQIETGSSQEKGIKSTKKFIHWMITGDNMGEPNATSEYRQAIIDDIKSGKLKNRHIIYYQEKGYATHATALDYLINKYDWNTPSQQSNTATIKSDNISYKNNPTNLNTYLNYLGLKDIVLNDAIFNASIGAISKERVFLNTLQQIVENTPVLSAVDIREYVAKDKQKDLPDLKPLAQRIHALSMALSQDPSEKDLREYVKLNTELNAKIIELLTPHIKKVFGKDASIEYKTIRSVDPLYNPQQSNTAEQSSEYKSERLRKYYTNVLQEYKNQVAYLESDAPVKLHELRTKILDENFDRWRDSDENTYISHNFELLEKIKSDPKIDRETVSEFEKLYRNDLKIRQKNQALNSDNLDFFLNLPKNLKDQIRNSGINLDVPIGERVSKKKYLEAISKIENYLSSQQSNTTQQPKTEITDAEVEAMTKALVEMYPEIELSIENNPNFVNKEGVFNQIEDNDFINLVTHDNLLTGNIVIGDSFATFTLDLKAGELKDISLAKELQGKGIGSDIYLKLNALLNRKGMVLKSSDNLSKASEALWESLYKKGYVEKTPAKIKRNYEDIIQEGVTDLSGKTDIVDGFTYKFKNNQQTDIQARKVLIDAAFKNKSDLISHEFAHHYIAWFRNTPLVQQGIKMYGSEEELVEAIGEQAVVQRGKAWSWWKKFVAWLLNSANDVSDLTKENLRDILTDAFLSRQDLNKQAGTEAGIKLEKNVAVLGGETYLWNNNTGFWQPFTKSEADVEYNNDEMQKLMQEERDAKAQVKNDPVIKPAWKNNKRAALENRLLNIHKAIALHPVNAQNLLAPVSTVITKGIVKKLGIRAKHETRGAVIDPLSNINASIAMVQGKQGVGIVANAINTKAALTGVDAKLTSMYPVQSPLSTDEKHTQLPINLRMLGIEKVRYADGTLAYSLGKLVDTFGNSIISNLSESLTQQVDNVKDPVAVELGYTLKTLGLTSYILTLGVPQEILAGLTAKGGIVTAWNDRVEENENLFHKGVTETDVYRNEFGQKETKTTKFEESNSTLKVEFIAGLLRKEGVPSKYIEPVVSENGKVKGYLLKHEALDADNVSLDKYDAVKLLFYWELIDQARAYGNTIKALTADTKTHKSIDAAAQQQLLIDQQLAGIDSIIDKDDISKVISSRTALKSNTKSVISPFFNMQRKYIEYFSKYFYTHDNGISSYLAANLKARYKLYNGDKLNRLISTAHNDFMIYLMTRMTAVNSNATSSLAKYNIDTAPLVEANALLKHGEGLKMSAVNSIYNNLVLISKQPNLTTSQNYYYAQPASARKNSTIELYQNITPEMARSLLDIFRFELGRVIKADVNVDNNTSIYLQNIPSVDLIMFKDSAITTSAANNYIEIFEELRTKSPKLIQLFNSISLFQAGLNNSPYNLFKTLPITDLLSEDKSKSLVSNLATTIRTFDKLLPKKGVAYSAEADKRSDAIYNMVDDFLRWFDLQYGKIYVQPEAASKYNKASRLYKAFSSKDQKFIIYVKNDEGGGTPLESVSSLTKNYLSTVPYTYAPTTTAVTNSNVITNDTINEDATIKQLESLGAFGDIIKAYVAAGGEIETLCS